MAELLISASLTEPGSGDQSEIIERDKNIPWTKASLEEFDRLKKMMVDTVIQWRSTMPGREKRVSTG